MNTWQKCSKELIPHNHWNFWILSKQRRDKSSWFLSFCVPILHFRIFFILPFSEAGTSSSWHSWRILSIISYSFDVFWLYMLLLILVIRFSFLELKCRRCTQTKRNSRKDTQNNADNRWQCSPPPPQWGELLRYLTMHKEKKKKKKKKLGVITVSEYF